MPLFQAKRFVDHSYSSSNILIGKAGLVPNLLPYVGPPLAQVLRQIESVVDVSLSLIFDFPGSSCTSVIV